MDWNVRFATLRKWYSFMNFYEWCSWHALIVFVFLNSFCSDCCLFMLHKNQPVLREFNYCGFWSHMDFKVFSRFLNVVQSHKSALTICTSHSLFSIWFHWLAAHNNWQIHIKEKTLLRFQSNLQFRVYDYWNDTETKRNKSNYCFLHCVIQKTLHYSKNNTFSTIHFKGLWHEIDFVKTCR